MTNRPIAISLSPNTERDDVLLAIQTLFSFKKWFDTAEVKKLESEFGQYFGSAYKALATNSGRSALYLILTSLGISSGDEVIIQAGTCVVVPNVIKYLGATPIYVDIDKSVNLDPVDLDRKVTLKTKAVIVQHSFGVPAQLTEILAICKKRNILLIEDCAISLGAKYKSNLVGTFGDAAFFSFGRDKIISSVFGGMILVKDTNRYIKIKKLESDLPDSSVFWGLVQLMHPILFALLLPIYYLGFGKITLGKILLVICQKIGLLSRAVNTKEKTGGHPDFIPGKLPPTLAVLARFQLKKVDSFNKKRQHFANYYFNNLVTQSMLAFKDVGDSEPVWVRFPIVVADPESLIEYGKKSRILLGDWYKAVVTPTADGYLADYVEGSCPIAEKTLSHIVNLPTYPTLTLAEAHTVVDLVKQWQNIR